MGVLSSKTDVRGGPPTLLFPLSPFSAPPLHFQTPCDANPFPCKHLPLHPLSLTPPALTILQLLRRRRPALILEAQQRVVILALLLGVLLLLLIAALPADPAGGVCGRVEQVQAVCTQPSAYPQCVPSGLQQSPHICGIDSRRVGLAGAGSSASYPSHSLPTVACSVSPAICLAVHRFTCAVTPTSTPHTHSTLTLQVSGRHRSPLSRSRCLHPHCRLTPLALVWLRAQGGPLQCVGKGVDAGGRV